MASQRCPQRQSGKSRPLLRTDLSGRHPDRHRVERQRLAVVVPTADRAIAVLGRRCQPRLVKRRDAHPPLRIVAGAVEIEGLQAREMTATPSAVAPARHTSLTDHRQPRESEATARCSATTAVSDEDAAPLTAPAATPRRAPAKDRSATDQQSGVHQSRVRALEPTSARQPASSLRSQHPQAQDPQ